MRNDACLQCLFAIEPNHIALGFEITTVAPKRKGPRSAPTAFACNCKAWVGGAHPWHILATRARGKKKFSGDYS